MSNQLSGTRSALPLERRPYGHDGVKLSVVGFGGIVVMNAEQPHANQTVAKVVERGVNYFEVAPTYGDAELRLGPALQPYRKNCFLACKTVCRDGLSASKELKQSLENLRTDYLDLYQLHSLTSVTEDVDAAFAKGGAMETLIAARKSGQVRYLGFSAHSEDAALAAMDRFDFDSVLFPINFAAFLAGNFGPAVIKRAEEKRMTVLAIKAMARQRWAKGSDRGRFEKCWYEPLSDRAEADLALRFTLSQPIATAVSPGEEELFWLAVDLAGDLRSLTETEMQKLRQLAAQMTTPVFGKSQ
jgi:aryl-alcohol dehydrogenase-like predicted oxidoreductase